MTNSLILFFNFIRGLFEALPAPIMTLFTLTFAFFIFFALYKWLVKGEPD